MSHNYCRGFLKHPTIPEIKRYMEGECAYFALALHQRWKSFASLVEVNSCHFAVDDNHGNYWDVRGRMNPTQLLNGFRKDANQIIFVDRDYVINELRKGLYSDGYYVPYRQKRASLLLKQLLPNEEMEL
jgi:hypothetical protein